MSTTVNVAAGAGDELPAAIRPENEAALRSPADETADRLVRLNAAWAKVLDAHDELVEMLAEDVAATAATMTRHERYSWRRCLNRARAELAELRADGPPELWGKR